MQQHLDKNNNKDVHNMNSSMFKMHKHSYTTFIGKFNSSGSGGNYNNSTLNGMKMSSSIMNSNVINSNKKVDNKTD